MRKNWNNTIDNIKQIYDKVKSWYDKGKYYYDKFNEFKNKIFLYKNRILNKINEIQNEVEKYRKYTFVNIRQCPICGKLECQYKINERKFISEVLEKITYEKNRKISSLIDSISLYLKLIFCKSLI